MTALQEFSKELKQEIKRFSNIQSKDIDRDGSQKDIWKKIKEGDFRGRIKLRNRIAIALVTLLYIQNIAVFSLVFWALQKNQLAELQSILSVLTIATLFETGYSIKIINEFLFKEISY